MSYPVVAREDDSRCVEAIRILAQYFNCETLILELGQEAPEASVAIFSTNGSGVSSSGRSGATVRMAAHRVQPPEWARKALFPVEVRKDVDGSIDPLKSVLALSRTSLSEIDFSQRTPWGGLLPTEQEHFRAYCEWLKSKAGINPQEKGVQYRPPVVSQARRAWLVKNLAEKTGLKRPFAESCVKAVLEKFDLEDRSHEEALSRCGQQISFLEQHDYVVLEAGPQTELLAKLMFEACLDQKSVKVVAPVCPAWSYDEAGYTFQTVHGDCRGICFDMMVETIPAVLRAFGELGILVDFQLFLGDVEWFDLNDGHYQTVQGSLTREVFMERICQQAVLIRQELVRRGLPQVEISPFLEVFREDDYLKTRRERKTELLASLESDEAERRYLANVIGLEAALYERQCSCKVQDSSSPPKAVRDATVDDIVVHRALIGLTSVVGKRVMYLVEADPFRHQYKDYPHLGWRSTMERA